MCKQQLDKKTHQTNMEVCMALEISVDFMYWNLSKTIQTLITPSK